MFNKKQKPYENDNYGFANVINFCIKKTLIYVLESFIARYPTTLQEDLQLLETTLPQFKKLAIQLRVTEKRIIFNALEYVRTNES